MTHSSLMSISPSFYDPYNNISFVELNKNRRRDYDRTPNERIYNQVYKPRTLKIYIRRNGDRESKPKQFIWRVWQSSKLSDLVEEAGNHLNMTEPEQLFDSHGRLITDSEQITEGAIYVVATQSESFDRRSVDIPAAAVQHHTTQLLHPRATAHQTKHTSPRRKPSMPYLSRTPSPSTHRHYREQDDIYSVNHLPYEPPPISTPGRTERPYSDYGQYNNYNSQYNEDHYHDDPRYNSNHYQTSRHTYPETRSAKQHPPDIEVIDDWGIGDLDEIKRRDHEMLEKHKVKYAGRRTRSAVIYNRKDQTNPDAYLIYAFLNGQGLECQHISFTRRQLEKGMKYLLELVAKKFNVNPSKLVNMDGVRIKEVSELMSRGAYVLVPVGQTFRETWYFLPDNAIDTSNDQEKIRNRSAQRDRYIQKQQKKLAAKRRMEMIKQKQHSRSRSVTQQYSDLPYRSQSVEPYLQTR